MQSGTGRGFACARHDKAREPAPGTEPALLLDIAKALSFFLSILSLGPVVLSAFFVPGSRLEDRLVLALEKIALAGCICFLSGILFAKPWRVNQGSGEHLIETLPVKMYLWTVLGVAILFLLSWYLEVSFVPWI
jgi:hypothetical protein